MNLHQKEVTGETRGQETARHGNVSEAAKGDGQSRLQVGKQPSSRPSSSSLLATFIPSVAQQIGTGLGDILVISTFVHKHLYSELKTLFTDTSANKARTHFSSGIYPDLV